jgi:hypothetical protein
VQHIWIFWKIRNIWRSEPVNRRTDNTIADRRMTKSGPQYPMQKTKKWATQIQPKTRGVLRYFQRQAVHVILVEPLACLDSGLLLTSKLLTLGFMRITLLSSIRKYVALKSWIGRPIRNVYLLNDFLCTVMISFRSFLFT